MTVQSILSDIETKGFSVQELIVPENVLSSLKNEITFAYHNISSEFKTAGIGKSADVDDQIRGDKISWLKSDSLSESQECVFAFLETLKNQFNEKFFFGLKDFETHVTVYPKNTFYKKHIDQFKNSNSGVESKTRKVSFTIYLNEGWSDQDGGELKLYDLQDNELQCIQPQFGRAVFFLSEEFPHEVLETKAERVSMTGWFYQ